MKVHLSNQKEHQSAENTFAFRIEMSPEEFRIKETPFGVRFEYSKEFKSLNEPGTPALPSKIVNVALPGNASRLKLETTVESTKKLFKKPVFVMPVQDLQVASARENFRVEKQRMESINRAVEQLEQEPRAIPFSHGPMPDPKVYNEFLSKPVPVAELLHTTLAGNNLIAAIRVNPITIGSDFIPVLNEVIDLQITYKIQRSEKIDRKTTMRSLSPNKTIQQSLVDQLKETVINPREVIDITHIPWFVFGQYDYIVVTDNKRWNSETMEPSTAVGDMVTAFGKLVDWKREKGLKARVVTITDIMNGVYGNFKTGAVDLQEVIRNFMKHAHSAWGVTWCLLGGDIEIVPVRLAAGECRGDVTEQTANNPPHDNEAFWTGTFTKIKAVSLGEWFSVNDSYLKLTNKTTGRLIPKKAPLNHLTIHPFENVRINGLIHLPIDFFETTAQFQHRLGWYFCTDETYTTYSSTPTNFVRVDGDASIIHAPLRFHYTWNTIPTDFYYASLFGPNYGIAGKHDWDANNNRLYGQHEYTSDFDPVNWHADIMVGRAPASTPAEAEVFVDKVLAYEKFRMEDGTSLDRNYLDKMLLVSTNWGGRIGYWATSTNPPPAGQFYTDAAHSRAILQTNADFTRDWEWELISWINDTDVWLIPYDRNAAPGVRGWYYAFGPTDLQPAIIEFNLPWGVHFEFPLITNTIVIYGNASDIAPQLFILDRTEADGSMMDSEALREQVDAELPLFRRFNRLYEDIDSLPIANRNAAPVQRFTDAALETALNDGHHFLSLSGHGSMGGCCGVNSWTAGNATNGNKYFIAFADSCLTNDYEYADSMSESLVNNPHGGAVAYVGHTRFSWIGLGDDFERAFFHELVNTRHIGLMHNSRLNVLLTSSRGPLDHYNKWSVLALNLLGDPEMEVRKTKPLIIIPHVYFELERLYIKVFEGGFARKQITDFQVRITTQELSQALVPDEDGKIPFEKEWLLQERLMVSITVDNGIPYTMTGEEIQARMIMSRQEEAAAEVPEAEANPQQEITKATSKAAPAESELLLHS
jgi:hypothetical protein